MPRIPETLPLRLKEMRMARDRKDAAAFQEAVIRSFEELERYWPQLRSDIAQAEVLP